MKTNRSLLKFSAIIFAIGVTTAEAQTGLSFTGQQEPEPTVVNRATGARVQFQTGTWSASDLFNREIQCQEYEWIAGEGYSRAFFRPVYAFYIAPENTDAITGTVNYRFEGREFINTWSISDNALSTDFSNSRQYFANSMWYEPIVLTGFDPEFVQGGVREAVRYWGEPGQSEQDRSAGYIECRIGTLDGNQSLRPSGDSTEGSCDYSNADLYGGWGWNATTSQSCEPLTDMVTTTADCVDSDGDGWGWDGTASCRVDSIVMNSSTDSDCDYSDADLYGGWGWNATARQSCAPLENMSTSQPAARCIDSDGDGWGWNGTESCIP